jgi:hypothetical protein
MCWVFRVMYRIFFRKCLVHVVLLDMMGAVLLHWAVWIHIMLNALAQHEMLPYGGRVPNFLIFYGAAFHSESGPPYYRGFTITLRHTTLDEWSARRTDLYLTTHNTQHSQNISMLRRDFFLTHLYFLHQDLQQYSMTWDNGCIFGQFVYTITLDIRTRHLCVFPFLVFLAGMPRMSARDSNPQSHQASHRTPMP